MSSCFSPFAYRGTQRNFKIIVKAVRETLPSHLTPSGTGSDSPVGEQPSAGRIPGCPLGTIPALAAGLGAAPEE